MPDVAFLDMGIRVEIPCDGHRLAVDVETIGVVQVRQVVEEVAHAAAHIQNAFCCFGSCYFDNLAAKVVRREELPHLEFFLGLRIVVIISEIGLFEAVQTSEAGIAVEDRFPGYFPFILVNGFQDSLVVIFPLFLGDRLILDLITHMSMVCE